MLPFAYIMGSVILTGVYAATESDPAAGVQAEYVVDAVLIAVVVLAGWLRRRDLMPMLRKPASWKPLAAGAGLSVATALFALVYVHLASTMAGFDVFESTEHFRTAGTPVAVMILMICVIPGVFEEIAFRGIVQPGLARIMRPRDAMLVTAAIFSITHLSLIGIPHLFVTGAVLGVMRDRWGSLYPCMVLHFMHNLAVVAVELMGAAP